MSEEMSATLKSHDGRQPSVQCDSYLSAESDVENGATAQIGGSER